ncbi:MAG TPA: hypothetical protein VK524_14930 [Polyangiaceae bacterium]|nr:hypothetical protein [Polyangiaceae bacterium]
MTKHKLLLLVATTVALSGCYSTTIRSGKAAGETPMESDDRWHSGFVGGTQEASGPYDLEKICPNGWSEIETKTSFANGFVDIVTAGIYNPQTVKVTCAAEDSGERASLSR